MRRLVWLVRSHGHLAAFWAAAIVLVTALALDHYAVEPLRQELAQLERREASRRQQSIARVEGELARPSSPTAQLANFYGFFSRGGSLTDLLARLYAVAEASGIEFRQADYRMRVQAERKLDGYQVLIPVSAPYPAIRRFIAGALAEIPTMALDQVEFERKAVSDNVANARITFTFYIAK